MEARFVLACSSPADLPSSDLTEVAVAGRSNCGKSSLINALTEHGKLARTSSTPGRTRQIIFFRVRFPRVEPFHLVDLPGYGFAKIGRAEQAGWAPLIDHYIDNRQQLRALLVLNDIRRPPGDEERDLIHWTHRRGITPLVVLTKADKAPKNKRFGLVRTAQRALALQHPPLACSIDHHETIVTLRRTIVELASLATV
jgi:GTP-binding protein